MILDELNESQLKAATFGGKHLLVLAGAGTGKTKTIVARAVYLINKGVSPSKIQILTFTRRAAGEIVSRVKSSLPINQSQTLGGSTFHSWCNQLLTNYPNLFGTKSYTVITEDDQLLIMKGICGKKSLDFKALRITPQDILDLYSFARNTNRNLTESIKLKLFNDLDTPDILVVKNHIEQILRGYEIKKKEGKYLDYDDIIKVVSIRLSSDSTAREIISDRYSHILVDEFQDTNPLQWELLEPLHDNCNLFCVGDAAQSIYAFRGADFKNVYLFSERVKDSQVYKLEDNYRSTQEILNLANWLLSKSELQYGLNLKSIRGSGLKPVMLNHLSTWDEANWIAERILENYSERGKLFSDHLILTRSDYYNRALQAIFVERRIPYSVYGGRKFLETAHIKDLVSALRVVNNKDDEIAWIRFLMFWEGIGEIKSSRIFSESICNTDTIEECIEFLDKIFCVGVNKNLPKVLKVIYDNRLNPKEAIDLGVDLMSSRFSVIYSKDWEYKREPDFSVLSVLASNYPGIGDFINECTLDPGSIPRTTEVIQSDNKDHVIISTIHSAKGLESDIVYLMNASVGIFPHSRSLTSIDKVEEDRRLLYVALTRAKNELFITRLSDSVYVEDDMDLRDDLREQKETKNESDLSKIEKYFFNGLLEDLINHEVVISQKNKIKDLEEPNDLNIDYGIDFS